ncbi:hypothetical protein [Streptomyces sp. NPDC058145]|uniref:hypothetical protein n=1 Tax=Streptomyces sp. NPDC058145 TaxID=3346356 RepID=UPI0036F0B571
MFSGLGDFCALRWGELVALRRRDVDLEAGRIRVRGSVSELNSGKRIYKAPKSEAGKWSVAIPRSILPLVAAHTGNTLASQAGGARGVHAGLNSSENGRRPRGSEFTAYLGLRRVERATGIEPA